MTSGWREHKSYAEVRGHRTAYVTEGESKLLRREGAAGRHFVQEDAGAEIGAAIAGWLSRLP